MKKSLLFFTTLLTLIADASLAKKGNSPKPTWVVKDPFEQKVFIENKGQYELPGKTASSDILFGAHQSGLGYYFTKSGIWIDKYLPVKRTEEELEDLPIPQSDKNNKAFQYKYVEQFHQINFIGSNPLAEIISSNIVRQHYNYTIKGDIQLVANAYKKIIYKNLYPGIDMEFYFPENKQGFEYTFIVHPGADVSLIKMQYPQNAGLELTHEGNISIKSIFGLFTDHAPSANQKNSVSINCSFVLQNGIVQFNVANYNNTQDLIIDPWTTTPVLLEGDRTYDVDWDNAGNCYAYGGWGDPYYQLLKYDSTGSLVWSYKKIPTSGLILCGDFAVDRVSQSVYIVEGFNYYGPGAQVLKVNSSGLAIDSVTPSANMQVMFRVALSRSNNELIINGGSTTTPDYTAMYIDTNFLNAVPVTIITPANSYHYMWGLTLDNYGNCYMATAQYFNDPSFNNILLKLPITTLAPPAWSVYDGYNFNGVSNVRYIFTSGGNGYNGMTVSNNDTSLYTYDSFTLKRWNTSNGLLVDSAIVNVDSNLVNLFINWGGLTSDDCDNIFLGSRDTIKAYNSNLTLVSIIKAPDTIYDVKLGNNNILYACGASFVGAYQLTPHIVTNDTNAVPNYKICLGNSVALNAASAISYKWSPAYGLSSTTGDSVIATPSVTTTYTLICTGSLSCPANNNDTFKIIVTVDTLPLPHIIVSPTTSTICFGKNVPLNASGVLNYQWSPTFGLNTNTGDNVLASPAVSTTYTVKGIDTNGCYDLGQSIVIVDTLPQVSVFPNISFICSGQYDSLYASGQPAYTWSPSTGLNSTTGESVIANPTISTAYSVTVTGNNGCNNAAQAIVYVYPTPIVTTTPASPSICPGHSISLKFNGANTYQWSPSSGLDSIAIDSVVASPSTTSTYTIIGTNYAGCIDTIQTIVTVGLPKVILSPPVPSICLGQSISLSLSGANTYQWNPSTGLNNTVGDTIIANPTTTTTYTIIGSNGCSDTITAVVTVDSLPTIVISPSSPSLCSGQSTPLYASGGNNYVWSPAFGLNTTTGDTVIASPTLSATYNVIGTNSYGCKDSTLVSITVVVPPNKPTIKQVGDTLFSSANQGNQWYKNDSTIAGATDSIYIITSSGNYTVSVVNPANGCSSESDSKYYIAEGIEQLLIQNEIRVFPNPFNNSISIIINSVAGDAKEWGMCITDVLGRTQLRMASLSNNITLDLSSIPSGVYFIIFATKTNRIVLPVIKQE